MTAPYYNSALQRVFDLFFVIVAGVFLAPLFGVAALAIWLESGGPIFFRQQRMGRHQRPFWIVKFRTMRPHTAREKKKLYRFNEAPAPMFKMTDDPRYTRVGKVLSRLGIDELPQIWNIVRGEMSLVGPRPLPLEEAALLPASWNFRYAVLPGILSEWAVSPAKHTSLASWKRLERETLRRGSVRYCLGLVVRGVVFVVFVV